MRVICTPLNGLGGSAAAHSLLEFVFLSEHGGSLPEIKKTPNGKPYFPDRPDVHFSLSHSKTHVLCALASGPVGVDIESPRCISEAAIRYFSSPEEHSLFDPLDLWVLKESYIKLIGGYLALVRKIRFSCGVDGIITPDAASVSKLYSVEGCHAAVSSYSDGLPDFIELVC